ncbi:alpha-L-rhamnosidase [Mariniphaga anaerophila]|uniref:alpha-L-rhamnosidase n=1 Tax=Mariniphaga anaerophila TaxID=1484053 RepID=A0A1M5ARR0_9BACT|nr:glycoside hydrolase family 78 protein [Mariniphaga anaerophila]SHF32930.1 alpha-L-rhamnosidase [Mariniphaga anaerophila]
MKRIVQWTKLLAAVFIMSSMGVSAAEITRVTELVCEYHTNPIGIDVQKPRLSWKILSENENVSQAAYEIRVADSPSNLNRKNKLIWSSGKVNSSQSVNVEYEGPEQGAMQRVYWQVRIWDNQNKATKWSEPAYWETGMLSPEQWSASWIMMAEEKQAEGSKPCQYLRKEFSAAKKVKSARIYASALGLYELYLNGEKVGDELFTPGWTSYGKRIQYQTYDVTSMLKSQNSLGAILGDGWYRGNIGFRNQHSYYGNDVALIAQLHITYSDGTAETIGTDESWKATTGALVFSDIYNGETYDARLEMPGWATTAFDDSGWGKVETLNHPKNTLIAPQGVPVKAVEEISPVEIITTPKGEVVFDMGQNMVGWVRMKVKGERGKAVTLKFAEVLDKDGNFYIENLRAAKATDVYILKGDGEEIYEPRFTFHGFRYLKVENFPGTPELDDITGVVIYSDMEPTGTFVCSEPLINQLQHNIQWGQKGNFLDVPTDCPQRDERLGWTGDAQVFCATAAFNFDVAAFYTKWMKDVAADQGADGKVPHVIPDVLNGAGGSTAWADAAVIVPWQTYLAYGDERILQVQYPSMKAWVEYMKSRAGDDYLWIGDTHYGDWLAFATTRSDYPGATTEKDLIATAYYAYSSRLLSEIALVLGKTEDAEKYATLSDLVKKAFVNEFVAPSGRLVSHTQTAYSLALAFELLPEKLVPKAAEYLAGDVRKFKHLTTGFVGTPLLCKTLSDNGYEDLAFMLLNRKEYPSWLYPVTQGATTIWERWDGQKPDGSFQNAGMNSFNHYAYGAIGEWLYNYVAGIQIDEKEPGYKHFFLAPHPGGGLTNAKATYKSMYGEIESGWKIEGEQMIYDVRIPANTTATVKLPSASMSKVVLNSAPLKSDSDNNAKQNEEGVTLKLGSGKYRFSYPL